MRFAHPSHSACLREKAGRILVEEISDRSEMIVDNIEKDHQTQIVGEIDKRLEVIRRSVGTVRRILQDAVISPSPPRA